MFHSHDGWFWKREGSDVVIFKGENFDAAKEVVRFNACEWASIVASVSEFGETATTWREALEFYDKKSAKPFLVAQDSQK